MDEPVILPPRSNEGQQDRRGFIGGSDAAIIMGCSPWTTPLQLFEQKTADTIVVPERTPEEELTLELGKFVEPHIIAMHEKIYGEKTIARNRVYADPEFPFMRCEIDFEVERSAEIVNADAKSVDPYAFNRSQWGEEGTDEVPDYYAVQLLFGLRITRRKRAILPALYGPRHMRRFELPIDVELAEHIFQRGVAFWNEHIVTKVPPPATTKEDAELLVKRYAGFQWEAPDAVRQALRELKSTKEEIKRLDALKEQYEFQVQSAVAEAARMRGKEGDSSKIAILGLDGKPMATWNTQSRSGLDIDALKRDHPEIVSKYTTSTTFRVMRPSNRL